MSGLTERYQVRVSVYVVARTAKDAYNEVRNVLDAAGYESAEVERVDCMEA